jgi:hypothetical protein
MSQRADFSVGPAELSRCQPVCTTNFRQLASPRRVLAACLAGLALIFGEAPLRVRRTASTEAIEEHGMLLVAVCAAVMHSGRTLVSAVRVLLYVRAAVLRVVLPRPFVLDNHGADTSPSLLVPE